MRKTHLHRYHVKHGKMTEFAGYSLPIWFKSVVEEHMAVRNSVGLFDISHMGRFKIDGESSMKLLDYVLPSNLQRIVDGRAFYSVLCSERGGIIDDVVTLRLAEDRYIMVVNAANREKDFNWLSAFAGKFEVEVADVSEEVAMLSLQGPKAKAILQQLTDIDLSGLKRYWHASGKVCGFNAIVSRTGYTGEDGFEIMVLECPVSSPEKAEHVWSEILEAGSSTGLKPCGLGARDTLRLEAGMCLYGQDIDETITPLEAKLDWLIYAEKDDFVGRATLRELSVKGVEKVRIGLVMKSGGIPRHGYDVLSGGKVLGKVTSGTFSPLLKKGIAMAYLPKEYDAFGSRVEVSVRGELKEAQVSAMPFYDTKLYGWRRER